MQTPGLAEVVAARGRSTVGCCVRSAATDDRGFNGGLEVVNTDG
jgi:hypothetical protein